MKVAFVTNFCPHYRVRTFELLAERVGAEFLFSSTGDEWYWSAERGRRHGDFPHVELPAVSFAGLRVNPDLPRRLRRGDYDAVVSGISGRWAMPASYWTARRLGLPFVLWTGVWHDLSTPAQRLARPLLRHVYRHADALVTYGPHVDAYLAGRGVEPERLFASRHATDNALYSRPVGDAEREELRRRLDLPDDGRPVLLYVGRLESSKGVDLLLPALARGLPGDPYLVCVGAGSRRHALAEEAERLGLAGQVRLAPPVAPEEVVPYYALASLLVLPSRTTPAFKEPWGLVVNEAFNQAVPAVTSDAVGAAAGGLVDETTGAVVPEGDAGALAAALDRLLADGDSLRRRGEAARRRVAEWTDEAMVGAFEQAIDYARNRPRGRASAEANRP